MLGVLPKSQGIAHKRRPRKMQGIKKKVRWSSADDHLTFLWFYLNQIFFDSGEVSYPRTISPEPFFSLFCLIYDIVPTYVFLYIVIYRLS